MNTEQILSWYTGKARERAADALAKLSASLEQGYWIPKVSRTVVAALSKANVAQKAAQAFNKAYEGLSYDDEEKSLKDACFASYMLLQYGSRGRITAEMAERADAHVDAEQKTATRFMTDLMPAWTAIQRLDATRPPPVITSLGVSPTITKTLEEMKLNPATVRICPHRFEQREVTINKQKLIVTFVILLWPEGTRHNVSNFNISRAGNNQCQACGHAIKVANNWIPLVVDSADGVPHSLWVGRDCSDRLFGIKVKGDFVIGNSNRPGTQSAEGANS